MGMNDMRMEDMILISVDDHLIEPPDLFLRRTPEKWGDEIPRVVTMPNGQERWRIEGKYLATVGNAAVAGRSREERHLEPRRTMPRCARAATTCMRA